MELLGPNQSKGSRHAQVIIGIKLGALLGALLVLITKTCLYFLVCRMFKNMFRFFLKNVTVTSSFMVQTLNIFFRQEAVYLELVTHRLV